MHLNIANMRLVSHRLMYHAVVLITKIPAYLANTQYQTIPDRLIYYSFSEFHIHFIYTDTTSDPLGTLYTVHCLRYIWPAAAVSKFRKSEKLNVP